MNRDALQHLFEEVLRINYQEYDDRFVLETTSLGNDALGEIAACNAGVKVNETGQLTVYDDSNSKQLKY